MSICMEKVNDRSLMKRRKELGITQEQLANALGKTPRTVSEWENGRNMPMLYPWQTQVLCTLLEISLEELVAYFPLNAQSAQDLQP